MSRRSRVRALTVMPSMGAGLAMLALLLALAGLKAGHGVDPSGPNAADLTSSMAASGWG